MKFKIDGKDTALRHIQTPSLELQHALRSGAALEELNESFEKKKWILSFIAVPSVLLIRTTANMPYLHINTLQQAIAVRIYVLERAKCVNTKANSQYSKWNKFC